MANITPNKTEMAQQVTLWKWEHLTSADGAGVPLGKQFSEYADRSVQIAGSFDGASVLIEGSHDGVNYHPVTDPQGNDISKTVAAREQMVELDLFVRPRLVNAGAATDITVTILARKTR